MVWVKFVVVVDTRWESYCHATRPMCSLPGTRSKKRVGGPPRQSGGWFGGEKYFSIYTHGGMDDWALPPTVASSTPWQPLCAIAGIDPPSEQLAALEVSACVTELSSNGRPALLSHFKRKGLAKLTDRQKLASALSRACRPGSLHAAAEAGDMAAIRCALLASSAIGIDDLGGAGGVTPLMAAVSGGHAECARLLLCASASLEATRSMNLTALMISCIRGRSACCALLLEASASTCRTDEDGWSSLMYACIHGHAECVSSLLEAHADAAHAKPNGFTCLMAAAVGGSQACVRAITRAGALLDEVSSVGWVAYEYAVRFHGTGLGLPAPAHVHGEGGGGGSEGGGGGGGGGVGGGGGGGGGGGDESMPADISDAEDERRGRRCISFGHRVPGHTHDTSWREVPVSAAALPPGARGAAYWCGSRYSHDTNVLQSMLRHHGVRRVESLQEEDDEEGKQQEGKLQEGKQQEGKQQWTLCWATGQV